MKLKYVLIILLIILIATSAMAICDKPSIHTATYNELLEIDDIGEVLSIRIVSYLNQNKTCSVADLDDIKGIGEERLKKIRRHYD